MLARALLATVAVLVLAWVGVLLRDQEVGREAGLPFFNQPQMTRAELVRNMNGLEDAEFLNPDTSWTLARAKYYYLRGYPRQATDVAESLVRSEPANVEAWAVIFRATRESDPGRSAAAQAQIKRLDPLARLWR